MDLTEVEGVQGDWKVVQTVSCKNEVFKTSLITSADSQQQQQLVSTKCFKKTLMWPHTRHLRYSDLQTLRCFVHESLYETSKPSIYQDDCHYTQSLRQQTLRSDHEFHY